MKGFSSPPFIGEVSHKSYEGGEQGLLNDSLEYCPHCHTNLQGDAIPEEQQKSYNATHFTRKIGMTMLKVDRIMYWQCPDCDGTWSIK